MDVFNDIQSVFAEAKMLFHWVAHRQMYIDLDISKEWGLAAMVYFLQGDPDEIPEKYQHLVEPIAFLSRMLTPAETRYWPTELELQALVWTVRRVRH